MFKLNFILFHKVALCLPWRRSKLFVAQVLLDEWFVQHFFFNGNRSIYRWHRRHPVFLHCFSYGVRPLRAHSSVDAVKWPFILIWVVKSKIYTLYWLIIVFRKTWFFFYFVIKFDWCGGLKRVLLWRGAHISVHLRGSTASLESCKNLFLVASL